MSENGRPTALWWVLGGAVVVALLALPLLLDDDADASDAAGFDALVQSGTCADPTDDLRVDLDGEDEDRDPVEPYVAIGPDGEPTTLGYYGAPGLPGFSVATIYGDEPFSMVITDPDTVDPVACGDLLQPQDDDFAESGVAVVQLLPVGSSDLQGIATVERTSLQRELDIVPARARILLTTGEVTVPDDATAGYDGYIQSGPCDSPDDELRIDLERRDQDLAVTPVDAVAADGTEAGTVAYYGSPGVGFGLATSTTDEDFSLVVEDPGSDEPVACGDILEPDDHDFVEAGVALVQLLPTGDAGVQGFAVMDRVTMQRELDVTPTQVRIALFAPPING